MSAWQESGARAATPPLQGLAPPARRPRAAGAPWEARARAARVQTAREDLWWWWRRWWWLWCAHQLRITSGRLPLSVSQSLPHSYQRSTWFSPPQCYDPFCVTCYSFWVVLCYVLQLLGGSVLRVTAFGWSCVSCYSFRVIARIGHFFFASGGVTDKLGKLKCNMSLTPYLCLLAFVRAPAACLATAAAISAMASSSACLLAASPSSSDSME